MMTTNKKYFRFYCIAALVFMTGVMAIVGCKKFETYPVQFNTPNYVYDSLDFNGDNVKKVMNNLYSYLPTGFDRIDNVVLGAATDDAVASADYSDLEILSKSRLNAVVDNPDGYWYPAYQAIRRVNLFLSQIGRVPLDPVQKGYFRAEARFIRSICYFEMIKRYGGVPLIGERLFAKDERINIPRSTFEQCANYIVAELDDIYDSLRTDPPSSADLGRITQGADLAFKSRVLLYLASPLNNPDGDLDKWQNAADAAKAVMDLGKFSLVDNYVSLFTTRQNKEVILANLRGLNQALERNNAPVGYGEPNQSNGRVSPTQELADAFPMQNGLGITDPASGYDKDNPYQNRDPRFYATLFYNGAMWLGRQVETFDGGLDKPDKLQLQTRTGYYMRKFDADFSMATAYSNQNHNFPIFRYGEILLNYAEAENELGQTDIAYTQLIALRKRAGIQPGVAGRYGLKADLNQQAMRKAIQRERRIEMAFEEQRYWDVRRWKIADTTFNKTLHGMQIIKNLDNTFTYKIIPVQPIIFTSPRMYLYPIPYEEVAGNPGVLQNPGWE